MNWVQLLDILTMSIGVIGLFMSYWDINKSNWWVFISAALFAFGITGLFEVII